MAEITPDKLSHLTAEERDQVKKLVKAHYLVIDLCRPRGTEGSREWVMSIPARPDYDPDIVIGEALRIGMRLSERLSAARGEIEALKQKSKNALSRCQQAKKGNYIHDYFS